MLIAGETVSVAEAFAAIVAAEWPEQVRVSVTCRTARAPSEPVPAREQGRPLRSSWAPQTSGTRGRSPPRAQHFPFVLDVLPPREVVRRGQIAAQ